MRKRDHVEANDMYQLAHDHNLIPRNIASAIHTYQALAKVVDWYDILNEKGEDVADLLLTVSSGDTADIDLILKTQYFGTGHYREPLKAAVMPVLEGLFEGAMAVRRISAQVPISHGRTKRALKALGFRHEGKIADGVQYYGKRPEDIYLLGLLPRYLKE